MEFTKFFTESVPFGESWRPKPCSKEVYTSFWTNSLLDFDKTLRDTVRLWQMEPYQFLRSLSRSDGEKGEKRSQRTILCEFKVTVENWFQTGLKGQFWLDFFENWQDGGYGELEMNSFGTGGMEGEGKLRLTQIPEFWLPIWLKFNKSIN